MKNNSQNQSPSYCSDSVCQSSIHQLHGKDSSIKTKSQETGKCEDSVKRRSGDGAAVDYSDVSPISSPDRNTVHDEEILSADSEGMCPELKRGND